MDNIAPPPSVSPNSQPRMGLAIAALVLGVLAVFASILVVGAFMGLLAMLLGVIHISRRRGSNGMAWAGIVLSALSIVLSVGIGVLYFKGFKAAQHEWAELASETVTEPEFAEWIGVEVPDLTMQSLSGEELKLSELRGRRVVLDFWATWCPPCRREIPHFIQLTKENTPDSLLIIGVSSEDEQTLKQFVEKEGINYPIVSTDDLPAPFDSIAAIPTTFFIDRNGNIQNVEVGYHDYDHLKELALADDLILKDDEVAGPQP